MKNKKVLVVGINPWIDNTGINTLIDFFDGWGSEDLAHIYTREKLPYTHVCENFFRISEPKVLKSVIKRKTKTGEKVYNTKPDEDFCVNSHYQKPAGDLKQLLREIVWKLGKWKTPELDAFIKEFNPDVLFFPVYSNVYMTRLQNYIAKKTKKPVILYSSDDNYSYKAIQKNVFSIIKRFWLRKLEKKLFKSAKKIAVISPKQKEEYDKIFKTECEVITKGIDYEGKEFTPWEVKKPIKMVYTGKLIIGRWKSLSLIADALCSINKDEKKIELDIYTTDILTDEQNRALNKGATSVKGGLSLEEVKKVQKDADVLVFVESLEKKYRYAARLSFSTKVTDYLKSGKCIFAIGDTDIAPIDYFKRYDSAVVATDKLSVEERLNMLCENPELICQYGEKAYLCGKNNHDKKTMKEKLFNLIENVK